MNWKQGVLAISMSLALPFTALADGLDEGRIRELVLETIRANPEIVMEAVAILERKQAEAENNALADILSAIRDRLEDDANAPVLGNPEGDVTVVEFFDYNCPYCRRAMEPVQGLLEADPNVRLIYREWPILGEGSVFAARAALAARKQGKYDEFHWALMAMNGRANEANVLRVASEIGLDVEQLRSDMEGSEIDEHIRNSAELAQALGFNGTPSFVIGNELAPGLVQQPQLMKMVASARAQE